MKTKGWIKHIRIIITSLIFIACLGVIESFVYADNFTKDFFITSPEYAESLSYTREDPPFMMVAPKGWYMAMMRPEAPPSPTGVYFFKNNPEEQGRKGILVTPYIKVDFFINNDIPSAIDYALRVVDAVRKEGANILTEVGEIKADGETGSHFTTDSPFKGNKEILDNYIFVNDYRIIMIVAVCESTEFEEAKKEILGTINSIKFNY